MKSVFKAWRIQTQNQLFISNIKDKALTQDKQSDKIKKMS